LHLVEQDSDVAPLGENRSDGLGDIRIGETGGGQLIEERLEEVMILAIDQSDFCSVFGERLAKSQSTKTSPDHDNAGPIRFG
jgi:hypothetical protein